jgi:tripartite-type tricarboxylate transporter receptor subunit TctC
MMIKMLRKMNDGVVSVFCAVLAICLVTISLPEAFAEAYPTKPVRIVVASTAGSSTDIVTRLIGGQLSEALGQQFIIDNRAGAAGRIGTEIAARSDPDGYTLLTINAVTTIDEAMYKNLKYDLAKDFAPISLIGKAPFVLVVNPSVPATSVKELVMLAKSRPGALKYGSGGAGSSAHLAGETLKFLTGIDILHVPYKGVTPAMTATMAGEVEMTFQTIPTCLPMIQSGKLRALAVTTAKRSSLLPDLPSIAEFVPGFDITGWYGLVAPAKTPPAILSKLNAEVIKALKSSAVREKLKSLGVEAIGTSEREFGLYISQQVEKNKKAIKWAGVRPQ